ICRWGCPESRSKARPTSSCTATSSPKRTSQPSTTTTNSTTHRPTRNAVAGSPAADNRPSPKRLVSVREPADPNADGTHNTLPTRHQGSLALHEYPEHARAIEQTATVDEIDAALRTFPGRVPVRSRLVVVVGWSLCSVPQISVGTGGRCAGFCSAGVSAAVP